TVQSWATALTIARAFEDDDYQLRALWGLWGTCINTGEFDNALEYARQFSALAASNADANEELIGSRLIGFAVHYLGDPRAARVHIERMLIGYVAPDRRSDAVRFQADQRVVGAMCFARILWLLGFPDQALRVAELNVDEARSINHSRSLCNA